MMLLSVRPQSSPFFALRSSTSTRSALPTIAAQRRAAISSCTARSSENHFVFSLYGTGSSIAAAFVPGRGEKMNVNSEVNSTSRIRLSVS